MKIHFSALIGIFLSAVASVASSTEISAAHTDPLETSFVNPPDTARPWVYWFWNNGNVTKEGITADLEAMKRVGIGGVILMDVIEKFAPPKGSATFMGSQWMDLFQFAVTEAARLGLKINMTSGPGWCGSSGPWITPELSMQTLVTTDTPVQGPLRFEGVLPQPNSKPSVRKDGYSTGLAQTDFYRDVAVVAFPEPVDGVVPAGRILDLSSAMDGEGHLVWDIPPGKWVIQRIGHASTGSSTRPPVLGGNGLECDKLSKKAADAHFAGMMKKLIDRAGPLAGQTLVATHVDSWEVGKQNWTPRLREEFQKRRGYDPIPFLPAVTSKLDIGGKAAADRFRWDFHETISELLAENYTGHLAELAHANGLRFTLEGYNLPFGDEATYTAAADEPMTEFWTASRWGARETRLKGHQMASVSHVYGRKVTGAESFTSDDKEAWKMHPAAIKAEGDYEFCQGVNRFVFHRYAHQPYLDRFPGATMGPWGLHYERTNTWWEMSRPWHEYIARCSYMLRQGLFVADLLYVRKEIPNQAYFTPTPEPPAGFDYDQASAWAIMTRASVKGGRIILPDGMSYRLIVLPPDQTTMTQAFLEKLKELVSNGAVISGPPPKTSPSLTDYPQCDQKVSDLAKELWGDCDGKTVTEHSYGKGRVFWGRSLPDVLASLHVNPDFFSDVPLNWIHRRTSEAEIYFVANQSTNEVTARCTFRTPGLRPESWNPETGEFTSLHAESTIANTATTTLHFDPSGSAFIVFRPPGIISQNLASPITKTNLLREITGPWEIHFPSGWGAPESVIFDPLISWSDSPDPGVKYFSGTATYRKTFDMPADGMKATGRTMLDLGKVEVLADVKLNGKDLGILWKPPYRVDVTRALKDGENMLEISVVNLWPNRMIGDASLPKDKRFTWSSWEPFTKETPLLKSGLLGPVSLRSCQ